MEKKESSSQEKFEKEYGELLYKLKLINDTLVEVSEEKTRVEREILNRQLDRFFEKD